MGKFFIMNMNWLMSSIISLGGVILSLYFSFSKEKAKRIEEIQNSNQCKIQYKKWLTDLSGHIERDLVVVKVYQIPYWIVLQPFEMFYTFENLREDRLINHCKRINKCIEEYNKKLELYKEKIHAHKAPKKILDEFERFNDEERDIFSDILGPYILQLADALMAVRKMTKIATDEMS